MKKRLIGRLGVVALALTLVSTTLMSGTLAKYTSEVQGTATATVAAWSFKANGEAANMTNIDIGDTTNRTTYTATDIKDGVIAPGTKGSFEIVLDGTGSEVGINYSLNISAASGTDLPADLKFSTDSAVTGTQADYTLGTALTGTIGYSDTADAMKKTITVNWEWDYGTADTTSSNDNAYQDKEWSLDIVTSGTQVTPTAPTT